MSDSNQLIIIGSGPAAWAAAIYTGRAGLAPLVFTGENPGGQLMLTTEVENFPGFPEGINGPTLMAQMRQQAEKFGARVVDEKTEKLETVKTGMVIKTADKSYETKAVIVATGAQARWLGVPGEKELVGRGVSACAVCDAAFFRNKRVLVAGGGDAAMEDALALSRLSETVIIVHRRDSFRASKAMIQKVEATANISIRWNSGIEEIRGDNCVKQVVIKDLVKMEKETIAVDGVFVAIGHEPATGFLKGTVELDDQGYVKTGITYPPELPGGESIFKLGFPTMTNVPGVFAGGDCVDFRYRQASTAVGLGVMAGLDAERWLEEKNR